MSESEIRKYAELMGELGLTGLEIDGQTGSIRLEREGIPAGTGEQGETLLTEPTSFSAKAEEPESWELITSPIVGVFYQAPMENAEPFVKVGDHVKKGDVLAIVEAMKLMNEIVAEREGIIREVIAQDGQMVDYNSPLFRMEV